MQRIDSSAAPAAQPLVESPAGRPCGPGRSSTLLTTCLGALLLGASASARPAPVPQAAAGFVQVASGPTHTLALRSDGTVVDWPAQGAWPALAPGLAYVEVNAGWLSYGFTGPNSTGASATIRAFGSHSLAENDLVLNTISVPSTPFLFLRGTAQAQLPFGNGQLCPGGSLVRIEPVGYASGNVAQVAVDLPTIGVVGPGRQYFQCWFRDPAAGGAGFDTSDALAITFVP